MSTARTRTTLAAHRAGVALTAGVLGAVLLAGCGSAGASAGAPSAGDNPVAPTASPGPDPCTLLQDDEAARMLHAAVKRTGPTHPDHGVDCQWDSEQEFVSVAVYPKQFYPSQQKPGARPVSGLGRNAFVGKDEAGAVVGDNAVFVTVYGPNGRAAVEDALRLAVQRAGRAGL